MKNQLQSDQLLQEQSDDKKLSQHDKNDKSIITDDDCNDLTSNATPRVQPSSVDATMPLILKYSRESEEKPSNVQSRTLNQHHDVDMTTDESLLMTCEFCGAVINPDFTPMHNNDTSSDSEEVNDI